MENSWPEYEATWNPHFEETWNTCILPTGDYIEKWQNMVSICSG